MVRSGVWIPLMLKAKTTNLVALGPDTPKAKRLRPYILEFWDPDTLKARSLSPQIFGFV